MAGLVLRVVIMIVILAGLFVLLYRSLDTTVGSPSSGDRIRISEDGSSNNLIPLNSKAEVVEHTYYILGYNERYEQAEWVSYRLTRDLLRIPNVPRAKRFEKDPDVSTGSADYYDYRGSGYSRGHLAPAGDMAQNELSMKESFLMSNMSPQKISFNGGIWRELEENVRDWTYRNDALYIVTGPILNDISQYIGKKNKVGVPKSYYKVILDNSGKEQKAIGFIIPNERSVRPIMDYAVTVNEVEALTGLDFFAFLLPDSIEERLESSFDPTLWKVNKQRYQTRVNNWNYQQ